MKESTLGPRQLKDTKAPPSRRRQEELCKKRIRRSDRHLHNEHHNSFQPYTDDDTAGGGTGGVDKLVIANVDAHMTDGRVARVIGEEHQVAGLEFTLGKPCRSRRSTERWRCGGPRRPGICTGSRQSRSNQSRKGMRRRSGKERPRYSMANSTNCRPLVDSSSKVLASTTVRYSPET